jgi:hypothetical protein
MSEPERADKINRASDDVSGDNGANVTSIRLIGYDKPFFTSLAIVLAIAAIAISFECYREISLTNYWLSRNEAFLEQLSAQGVNVPKDLLHKE